ncbi:MAG TPA: ABC transporter permease [Gammaproteobacteria bacterium]|nr:ABC transporter permease [Gammaproteobacteria bacterium]
MTFDVRAALRQLGRRPGFAAAVILMLAVGIGATTAIYTLFDQVLLRPLPVPEPDRLVNLAAPGPKRGATSCSDAGGCDEIFSYPMFRDLEARQTVFAGIAAHRDFDADFAYGGRTLAGSGALVSGSYFSVLGLRAALGRLIGPEDEPAIGEAAVAVLGFEHWRTRFGADPGIVGRTIRVNGRSLTVVGVAPEGFAGTTVGRRAQVFVPITLRWLMEPTRARDEQNRRSYWVYLFARLAPNVSPAQAREGINTLYSGIVNEVEAPLQTGMSDEMLAEFRRSRLSLAPGARGQSAIAASAAQPLTLLLGVMGLVLLIVCVNIANLLLVQGAGRAGELAVRASIGAGGRRLAAQLLTEAAVLAAAGGIASVPVAFGVLRGITALLPETLAQGFAIELDRGAVLVTAAASMLTLVVFGVAPALQAARTDPATLIKGQAPQGVGGRGVARFRSALATAQIAFSLVLLVLAGLFARSLANIFAADPGVDTDALVTFTLSPRRDGYDVERATVVFDRVEAELAAQPGVSSVASSRILLFDGRRWSAGPLTVEGIDREPVTDTLVNAVSPSFFRTLSIPLLGGRELADSDTPASPPVAVVNETFVRRFGLGPNAIGKRVLAAGDRAFEIVGIVADTRYRSVKDEVAPQLFIPRAQFRNLDAASFYVRGAVALGTLLETVPRAVAAVDPNLPVARLMTMRAHIDDNVYLDRLVTLLAAAFAALATLLAAIGLYAVLAYGVRQRVRELGLRLALGATPARLRTRVLRDVALLALIGLPAGLAGGLLLGRAAETLLFRISARDPAALAAAVCVLAAVVLAAGFVPARTASRLAPMEALRHG